MVSGHSRTLRLKLIAQRRSWGPGWCGTRLKTWLKESDASFSNFLKWAGRLSAEETTTRLLEDLDAAKLEQEWAKEVAAKLFTDLDTVKAKQDEAANDAEATILAKRDLKNALAETTMEVTSLHLQQFDVKASIRQFSYQGERAQGEASELSAKLTVMRAEVATLRGQAVDLGMKEAELLASSRHHRRKFYYCRRSSRCPRKEFEPSHYTPGSFVKVLSEVVVLYPRLDLSSLYGSP
ncbi:hypothetical protein ACLOJK_019503 [Asimina triloba]